MSESSLNISNNSIINESGIVFLTNNVQNVNSCQTSNHSVKLPYYYQLPIPSAYFCGRKEELNDIEKCLEENTATVLSQTTISGLGGVGKSEIVKAYAAINKDKYPVILFIISDSPNSLWNEFKDIADELKIPIKTGISQKEQYTRSLRNIVDNIYKYCSSLSNTLVVFDNVDEPEHIINYLPRNSTFNNKVHVIMTSRVQGVKGYWDLRSFGKIKVIPIDVFTSGTAYEFVTKVLDESLYTDDQIKKLCELLQFLPLALSQATCYIKSENEDLEESTLGYTIENYIQDYECKKTELLGYQDVFSDYNSSVITTWKITIDKLKSKGEVGNKAIELLEQMSYFPPDDIPVDIFLIDKETLNGKAVTLLRRYSFINRMDKIFTMHRLVQEVTKIDIKENRRENIVLNDIIKLLNMFKEVIGLSSLFYACKKGMTDVVKHIIENEFDPTERDIEGLTAIFYASNLEIVRILVESQKFNIKEKDNNERTILMYSCCKNDLDIVKYLISTGEFDLNDTDIYQRTAFLHACTLGSIEIVKYFLDNHRSQINIQDKNVFGATALMFAFNSGDIEKVKLLMRNENETDYESPLLSFMCKNNKASTLENFAFNINQRDNYGITSLMFACQGRSTDAISFILENSNNKFSDRDDFERTPFIFACWKGNLTVVKYLVENYRSEIKFDDKNGGEETALMFACRSGDLDKVKYLMELNVFNIYETDVFGSSSLSYAFRSGDLKTIQYLLENFDFDINERNHFGKTLLMNVWEGNLDLFNMCESQLNSKDYYDRTTFMHICWSGSVTSVKNVVDKLKSKDILNNRDQDGRTALMYATLSGRLDKIKYLISLDESAVYDKDRNEWNLLMYACIRGNLSTVKYLLNNFNFDINERNHIGMNLLMCACQGKTPATVEYLFDNSDNKINDTDVYNRTPFMHACWNFYFEIVRYLYENYKSELDLNHKDYFGRNAFTYACWSGSLNKIKYLLDIHDFDVNDKDADGTTILMYLCKGCRLDSIRFLSDFITFDKFENDYEISLKSTFQCRGGNLPAIRYLIENYDVDVCEKDNFGRSALTYACTEGHQDVVDYLLENYDFVKNKKRSRNSFFYIILVIFVCTIICSLYTLNIEPEDIFSFHSYLCDL